ncbi:hypothetical protein F5X68DRAFT_262997 [Plectosphaerella plurivora]|uniref:U6 small nuclear RNA (adenine-(43)-N(6))-methyltransferase n=1 Tax=Plectosphaerella plurivora TaxID=936078 RepID=A0A9P8V9A9_9PEZI|nr:hypothetical protein F5X68DRAFT_262997 [Plectosphaerella plurivora]
MTGKRRRSEGEDGGESSTGRYPEHGETPATVNRALPQKPLKNGPEADSYYRNLYAAEVDFAQLGRDDPDLGKQLRGNSLDFNNPQAVMQLTKSLLKRDFGLLVDLPDDRLCPPVPIRHNYILWLKLLMDSSSYSPLGRKLTGLDIGTGASCIYPLLGCTERDWSFVATDVDIKSLEYARKNVQLNGLESRIRVLSRTVDDPMIPLEESSVGIDFTMSNPPFYESNEDLVSSAKSKSRRPYTACTGSASEMVVVGGETAFVGRILDESLTHRDRIQWYTSMFGKQSSCEAFIEKIRDKGITNYAVTEFVQGSKTRRWALGWSFAQMRPSTEAARGVSGDKWKKLLPPIVDIPIISLQLSVGVGKVEAKIHEMMSSLELISWDWDKELLRGVGRAGENVWSRAFRRRKAREGANSAHADTDLCAFGFEVLVSVKTTGMDVSCHWREGHDAVIFESFTGYLKTQLKSVV